MKQLTVILLFTIILFSATLNQKIIIDVTTEPQSSTYILQDIQDFFQKNTLAKSLKSKYNLSITENFLEGYHLIEIKPIYSIEEKNELKLLLHKTYPQFFIVDNTAHEKSVVSSSISRLEQTSKNKSVVKEQSVCKPIVIQKEKTRDSLLEGIFNEWFALIVLALIGLLLVYRSTRQVAKIKALQKRLEQHQDGLRTEVDLIGGRYE